MAAAEVIDKRTSFLGASKSAAVADLTGRERACPGTVRRVAVDKATFSQALLASPAARLRSTLDPG
jgi:hypothetical protein